MGCHYSRCAIKSSMPSERNWKSSGNRRPCTRLWATHPPSPCAYILTLADVGKGTSSSLKAVYKPFTGREKDATFVPAWAVGRKVLADSRIIILPDTRGGALAGESPGTLRGDQRGVVSSLNDQRGEEEESKLCLGAITAQP